MVYAVDSRKHDCDMLRLRFRSPTSRYDEWEQPARAQIRVRATARAALSQWSRSGGPAVSLIIAALEHGPHGRTNVHGRCGPIAAGASPSRQARVNTLGCRPRDPPDAGDEQRPDERPMLAITPEPPRYIAGGAEWEYSKRRRPVNLFGLQAEPDAGVSKRPRPPTENARIWFGPAPQPGHSGTATHRRTVRVQDGEPFLGEASWPRG